MLDKVLGLLGAAGLTILELISPEYRPPEIVELRNGWKFELESVIKLSESKTPLGKMVDLGKMAWSPRGDQIAVLGTFVRHSWVFTVPDGKEISSTSELGSSGGFAFLPDGRIIIPARNIDRDAFDIWNPQSGEMKSISFASGTSYLVGLSLNRTGKTLLGLHGDPETAFATAIYENKENVWTYRGRLAKRGIYFDLSADGEFAALSGDEVTIFNTHEMKEVASFKMQETPVNFIKWSPDGSRILTSTAFSSVIVKDGERQVVREEYPVQIWDFVHRKPLLKLDQVAATDSADFSPNGELLAIASSLRPARIFDGRTFDELGNLIEKDFRGSVRVQFSPSGNRLAVAQTATGRIYIYRYSRKSDSHSPN